MEENGSPNFNAGAKRGKARRRAFVVSIIAILALAALPLSSAFAAPIDGKNNAQDSWNQKVQNLRADIAVSRDIVTIPGKSKLSAQEERWLDLYVADLKAAEALVAGRFFTGNATTSSTAHGTSSSNTTAANANTAKGVGVSKYFEMHPDKLLAMYLHDLRVLRAELGLRACPSDLNHANNSGLIVCFRTGVNIGSTTSTGTGTTTGTGGATATPVPSPTPSPTPSTVPSPTPSATPTP